MKRRPVALRRARVRTAPAPRNPAPPVPAAFEARFPLVRILRPDGTIEPGAKAPEVPSAELVRLYKAMTLHRTLDDRMTRLQRQGRVGFHIGSVGEEAAILGSAWVLGPRYWIFPAYREIGAAILRGLTIETFLQNMFGTSADPAKGRQMPVHPAAREQGYFSVSSPVGTQIPQAVGAAWGAKIRGDDVVSLSYFGDGATSEGDFHVGLNFAGVFKAPCIFICRNNGWAISVPTARQTASETMAQKAIAYGIEGVRVDGNDLFAVIAVTRAARERARRGDGATLVEALTYRLGAHSTSDDPRGYRNDEEVERWKEQDPIVRVRRHLAVRKLWSDTDDTKYVAELDARIRGAIAEAEKTPPPPLASMFEDVYVLQPWHLREQAEEAARFAGPGE